MRRHFVKMHGLGNDFVIFDATATPFAPDAATVRRLADRRLGIGCDQVLVLDPPRAAGSAAAYRIYNAAGEAAEQCGNGARCLARYVAQRWLEARPGNLQLDSPAGPVLARFESDGEVTVQMGVPQFEPAAIPFLAAAPAHVYTLTVDGEHVSFGAVSIGNPHAVLQVSSVDAAPVARIGPALQRHPSFPAGVNVGFMQILSPSELRLRVCERGVGETLACGTGACAAVAVGRDQALLEEFVTVHLPGGRLMVKWSGVGQPLWMSGPTEQVYEGHVDL
jgi:diaminopimelate epimerase